MINMSRQSFRHVSSVKLITLTDSMSGARQMLDYWAHVKDVSLPHRLLKGQLESLYLKAAFSTKTTCVANTYFIFLMCMNVNLFLSMYPSVCVFNIKYSII